MTVEATLSGNPGLAVGNVVGSCVFNLGAVLGRAAALAGDGVPVAEAPPGTTPSSPSAA